MAEIFLSNIDNLEKLDHIQWFVSYLDEQWWVSRISEQENSMIIHIFDNFWGRYEKSNEYGSQTEQTIEQENIEEEQTKQTIEQESIEEEQTEQERNNTLETQESLNKAIEKLWEQSGELAKRFDIDSQELESQAQQRQELIQEFAKENGQEISQEQAYIIAYSGVVRENLPANAQNDPQVQEFLWNYDRISATLWIRETLQSAEYLAQSNKSFENFRSWTDINNLQWREQAQEKFGDNVDNIIANAIPSIAFKESLDYMKWLFSWNFENNTYWLDDTANMDVSNWFFLKMNIEWTEVDFNFEGDNATVIDYLPNGNTFEWKERQLAFAWDIITPDILRDKLSNQDISSIIENSDNSQEFQNNLQTFLQDKAR